MIRLHGTCIDIDGSGVLLRGASGSGKSDLALRLIDEGARLVADDQVEIEREGEHLAARPPATIAGMMEVRGLGLFRLGHIPSTVRLVIDLVPADTVERLPDPETVDLLGIAVPLVRLAPWESSVTAKVRLALRMALGTLTPIR